MSEKSDVPRNLSWHCALVRSSHENFSCLALLFMCRHQNLMSESSSLSIAAGFAIVERVLSAGFSANRDVMTWRVQKRERFLHAVALYCSRMKKTLPDLEFLSIPPVFKRGTDRNNDP